MRSGRRWRPITRRKTAYLTNEILLNLAAVVYCYCHRTGLESKANVDAYMNLNEALRNLNGLGLKSLRAVNIALRRFRPIDSKYHLLTFAYSRFPHRAHLDCPFVNRTFRRFH